MGSARSMLVSVFPSTEASARPSSVGIRYPITLADGDAAPTLEFSSWRLSSYTRSHTNNTHLL
jgi:hypothetical protein